MEHTMTQPQRPHDALRLRYRNPIALVFSSAPWRAVAYLCSSVILLPAWFALSLAVLLVGVVLSLTWAGLPVLLAALFVVQAFAAVERRRASRALGLRIAAPQRARGTGLRRQLAHRLRSRATWREIALLVPLFPVLFVLDLLGLLAWLIPWTLISLPFWYRYPPQTFDNGTMAHGVVLGYYPDGPRGTRRYGWFIDDLHSALIAAGVGVLLLLFLGSYAAIAAARAHTRVIIATGARPSTG